MAEVRSCIGKIAHGFAHRKNNCYLLVSRNKHEKSVVQGSLLPAGFLLVNSPNSGPYGAKDAADRVSLGVSPDSYAKIKPQLEAVSEDSNAAENDNYRRLEEYSPSSKNQVQRICRNMPRQQRYTEFWRTLSCTFHRQHLYRRNGQWAFVRAYSGNGATTEPLYKTKTGYYEVLGVLPSATQAQIKTAYYKQSFTYHPDRNSGSEEATVRFSEISEAYTVLGNKGLRKKYDRGLLSLSDLTATVRPSTTDTAGSSARSQAESRRPVMGADGRGGIFDFDKFFKSHYGEQLQRQRDIRVRKEEMLKKERETIGDKKMGKMMEVGVGMLLVVAIAILLNSKKV